MNPTPSATVSAMKSGFVSLLASVSLMVGCTPAVGPGEESEAIAFASDEIVNGSPDPGHPATVALTVQGFPFCSGTLVTPTVVVTAAHCIHPGKVPPVEEIEIFFGSNVFGGGGTFIDVIEGQEHPDFDPAGNDPQNDIAVLRLEKPASVAPVQMAALPPNGTELTLVGFGVTVANGEDSGLKRVAEATIAGDDGSIFFMELLPSGTCSGDSGGTALWNDGGVEKLVGVHTRSDCQDIMLDETVGSHIASFIQPFIDAGATTCAADGGCAANCPSPDPDCPCADDGHCTAACTDVASDPDCNPECAGGGACVEPCPAPDPDCPVCGVDGMCNEACNSDLDCESGEGGNGSGGEDAAGGGSSEDGGGEGDGCGCRTSEGGSDVRLGLFALALILAGVRRRP
jgi:MYXO-CTERM domain-containing protein